MKLVDILARELKEWPDGFDDVGQADDGSLHLPGVGNHVRHTNEHYTLAENWINSIVTRAQWEAARAKLSKPKGGKDGWIRHRGGKCPVEAGTLVDVRYRDGEIHYKRKALSDCDCDSENWIHEEDNNIDLAKCDIMAYRIHTPSEQPATVKESLSVDPLAWRDRINEIDAESKAEAERHCQVMTALDSERAELVRKLANEGLALIGDNH